MFHIRHFWRAIVFFFSPIAATAQTVELLPEIDTYVKLTADVRLNFQARETREGGDPTQAEMGPSIDFYALRINRVLQKITNADLDDAKQHFVTFSIGYRYLPRRLLQL